MVRVAPAGMVPETVAAAVSGNGPAAVYASAPAVTEQASVNGIAGSTVVIVITLPALVAWTSLLSGSWVAGSGCTAALIVAAILTASAVASVSDGPAVQGTATELIVVTSVSPCWTAPVIVAVWAAGTGGPAE